MAPFFGILYAVAFVALCARRPLWALVALFATTPFHFSLNEGMVKYSITEINLLLTLPLLALRLREMRQGASLGSMALPIYAYLLVAGLSSLITWKGGDAIVSWVQMVLYLIVTVLIFALLCKPDELRKVPYFLVGVCVFWSLFGIRSDFFFMFLRKNAFGASLAVGFLCAYELWIARGYSNIPLRKDWTRIGLMGAMLIIFVGLAMTLSRGAWLGTLAGMIAIGVIRGNIKPLLRISAILVPVALIFWLNLPPTARAYVVGFNPDENRNIELRVLTLEETQALFYDSPIFGQGLGLRRNIDATNLFWLVLSETGVLGAITFSWMFWNFYRLAWRARAIVPPSDPRYTLLSLGVALMTYKLFHGMVDHYWTRGVLTNAWAGLGMVLCYYRIPAEARARELQEQAKHKRAERELALQASARAKRLNRESVA